MLENAIWWALGAACVIPLVVIAETRRSHLARSHSVPAPPCGMACDDAADTVEPLVDSDDQNDWGDWLTDIRNRANAYAADNDYTPQPHQIPEYEDIFGAQLAAGHSIKEAARFLVALGNNRL